MEATNQTNELKRVRTALTLNLIPTAFAFYELIVSINSGTTWRIVCAAAGFSGLLFLVATIFLRLMKVQKAGKNIS